MYKVITFRKSSKQIYSLIVKQLREYIHYSGKVLNELNDENSYYIL